MADPFTGTMAAVGLGAQIFGGIEGAKGAQAKADADSQLYAFRAGIARTNARINRQNSNFALDAGEKNVERSGLTTGFTIARQKVIQSGGGFDVNTGSAEAVRDSTRDIGVVDQSTIRTEFERKAKGFRTQADVNEQEASMNLTAGSNAQKAGDINVLSTLIGTAGSVASKWPQASNAFTGGGSSSGVTLYGSNMEVTGYLK